MADIDLPEWPEDRALLDELGEVLRAADPIPEQWLFAAVGSFTWRSIDAELAELAFDSADAAGPAGALVRGPATAERLLVFEAATLQVELEVTPMPGGRYRVLGQLVPEAAGIVELRQQAGSTTVEADAAGRFEADCLAAGPLSLRCAVAGAAPVETAWLLV